MNAIPDDVPVVGVEIDPRSAEIARENTGRTVITGDFAQVELPDHVTAIIGNPPFSISVVESFLTRAYKVLPKEGRIGLLLPTYHFQTFGRVDRWMQSWGLHVDMIPRGIFPGIRLPLAYCLFAKDARHEPHGLALYGEAAAIANLTKDAQELLTNGRKKTSVWRALVSETLKQLGGRATLDQMYRHIEPKRPTATTFWREKIRQQLQRNFVRCGQGEWAFDAQLAAA
jgi:site-specific DNA-methyltransferase (adenine-specific)